MLGLQGLFNCDVVVAWDDMIYNTNVYVPQVTDAYEGL